VTECFPHEGGAVDREPGIPRWFNELSLSGNRGRGRAEGGTFPVLVRFIPASLHRIPPPSAGVFCVATPPRRPPAGGVSFFGSGPRGSNSRGPQ
jgi:hypothetical protein